MQEPEKEKQSRRGFSEISHLFFTGSKEEEATPYSSPSPGALSSDLRRLICYPGHSDNSGDILEFFRFLSLKDQSKVRKLISEKTQSFFVLDKNMRILFADGRTRKLLNSQSGRMGEIFNYYIQPDKPMLINIYREDKSTGVGKLLAVKVNWQGEPAYLVTIREIGTVPPFKNS